MDILNLGAKIENDYELRMTDDELAVTQKDRVTGYSLLFTIQEIVNSE